LPINIIKDKDNVYKLSLGVSAVAYTAIAVGVTYAIYKAIDLEHEGP